MYTVICNITFLFASNVTNDLELQGIPKAADPMNHL